MAKDNSCSRVMKWIKESFMKDPYKRSMLQEVERYARSPYLDRNMKWRAWHGNKEKET